MFRRRCANRSTGLLLLAGVPMKMFLVGGVVSGTDGATDEVAGKAAGIGGESSPLLQPQNIYLIVETRKGRIRWLWR